MDDVREKGDSCLNEEIESRDRLYIVIGRTGRIYRNRQRSVGRYMVGTCGSFLLFVTASYLTTAVIR